ncbi:MAG: preprotein translocase subunit SecG [Ruminococcaceae bacterium]|nr:preprotein translocase subunit SecG [Oscillospiraceae bacterium]
MEDILMQTYEIVLGIVLMVLSVALTVIVLFQQGKDKNLSGSITGAAEGYMSRGRANSRDRMLNKITVALSVIFVLIIIAMYCLL